MKSSTVSPLAFVIIFIIVEISPAACATAISCLALSASASGDSAVDVIPTSRLLSLSLPKEVLIFLPLTRNTV